MRNQYRIILSLVILAGLGLIFTFVPAKLHVQAQQPTGSVPTVTGTPTGPTIRVTNPDQINVRSGPSSYFYPVIGVLLPGEERVAVGRSPGKDWIQIVYPGVPGGRGWVYAPLVALAPGSLPIVEPPPTATPRFVATIDPTLAAAFPVEQQPTRLLTFTPPAPLVIPTFPVSGGAQAGGIPVGLLIFGIGFIGLFGALIALLRGR